MPTIEELQAEIDALKEEKTKIHEALQKERDNRRDARAKLAAFETSLGEKEGAEQISQRAAEFQRQLETQRKKIEELEQLPDIVTQLESQKGQLEQQSLTLAQQLSEIQRREKIYRLHTEMGGKDVTLPSGESAFEKLIYPQIVQSIKEENGQLYVLDSEGKPRLHQKGENVGKPLGIQDLIQELADTELYKNMGLFPKPSPKGLGLGATVGYSAGVDASTIKKIFDPHSPDISALQSIVDQQRKQG